MTLGSTSMHTTNLSELSAFCADDSLVEIVPQFTMERALPLRSNSKPVGPWQAGIATEVPLWLATHLQTKRLATIVTPAWLTVANLSEILALERRETVLWRDESRLPANYYQIAQRLNVPPAVQLLLTDLVQVRMDKLRQQFQDLLQQQQQQQQSALDYQDEDNDKETEPAPLVVEITGMGSVEIALLQKTVQQALHHQDKLRYARATASRRTVGTTADKDAAVVEEPSSQASSQPPRRVPLRKFR